MKKNKYFFFFFILIQGILYLFIIPPWQSPDETHHFGYIVLLSTGEEIWSETYENLNKEIIDSMVKFNAWKYQNIQPPEPMPKYLYKLPHFGVSGAIYSLPRRSPLYYHAVSFILKKVPVKGILNQLYFFRLLSFFMYLITIYFVYLISRIVFRDNLSYCFAAVSFTAFLPQFLMISTSVNPINFMVLLETILIYILILNLKEKEKIWTLIFIPLIFIMGLFLHRSAIFLIVPFVAFLIIFFIQSWKNKKEVRRIAFILFITLLVFIGVYLFFLFFYPEVLEKAALISGIKPRISEISQFIQYLSGASFSSIRTFLDGVFKSFWYFAGWMRYPYNTCVYSVLTLICLLSFIGLMNYLILSVVKKNYTDIYFKSFVIFSITVLSILLGVIVKYLPEYGMAQGRYLFPAISAIGILFVWGLKEVVPKKWEHWVPLFVIFGFVVLDIYTIFHPLVRAFYFFRNF